MNQPFLRAGRFAGIARATTLAAVAALVACSDDPQPAASAGGSVDLDSIQACELLTLEEIEAATGIAAAPGDGSTVRNGPPMCNWSRQGGLRPVAGVLVTVSYYGTYEEVLEASDGIFSEENTQHVEDVGDFGVWLSELNMLQVYGDDMMVQVAVDTADGRDALGAAKTLAESARSKLR